MPSQVSVLIIERRSAIAASIASVLDIMPEIRLLGNIAHVSERNALATGSEPAIVVCGAGILLPHTLSQFPELRTLWPQAHLIALSFDPSAESRELALSAGADKYVSGLNLREELRAAIQSLLGPDSTRELT
jgi:DNA-binding NarL/FixJ family response regulator